MEWKTETIQGMPERMQELCHLARLLNAAALRLQWDYERSHTLVILDGDLPVRPPPEPEVLSLTDAQWEQLNILP